MRIQIKFTIQNEVMKGATWIFSKPGDYIIGRAPDCNIQISENDHFADVSRHHCKLEISPPNVWVRDLESKNGTFINGRRIGSTECELNLLHSGDVVGVGPLLFGVEIDEDPT